MVLSTIWVFGALPNMSSKSMSMGRSPVVLETNENLLSALTSPTLKIGALSLSAMSLSRLRSFSAMTSPMRS